MEAILQRLKNAKVIAILRGKNPERLYHRGIELAKMGCTAIEVTLDSNEAFQVVEKLRRDLDEHVLIGVGTLTDTTQVNACVSAGAQFALSPIHPKDMVARCHAEGILAIPGVATPAQLDVAIADGALLAKLFPSTDWTSDQLASVDIPWMMVGCGRMVRWHGLKFVWFRPRFNGASIRELGGCGRTTGTGHIHGTPTSA